jgi:hypothetical protein
MKFIKLFIFIFFFTFLSSFYPLFASETCTEGTDCETSINENTYNIDQKLDELSLFIGVDEENPIQLLTIEQYDEFNDSFGDLIQVFGIFSGLLLFSNFFVLSLFLYKR